MGRGHKSREWSFSTGALGPWLAQSFIEAVIPKAIRQQQQEQVALAKLAEFQQFASKLPEAERENFYNRFFRAFGVSQVPWVRGVLGEKPEPILPLPKGATYSKTGVEKTTTGMPVRVPQRLQIPPVQPFTFPRTPLIAPEEEREIDAFVEKSYPQEEWEDAKAAIKRERVTGRWTTADERTQAMVRRAEKLLQEDEQKFPGAVPDERVQRLPPGLRTIYKNYVAEREYKEEDVKSRAYQRREGIRQTQEKIEGRRSYEQATLDLKKRQIALQEEKFRLTAKNATLARTAKSAGQALKMARDAFAADRRYAISQNKLELDKQKNAMMMGREYIPLNVPIPGWDDWLANEGAPFLQAISDLQAGQPGVEGGVAPSVPGAAPRPVTPPPTPPGSPGKSKAFQEIYDTFFSR